MTAPPQDTAVFTRDPEGHWLVELAAEPRCHSHGRTLARARAAIAEAAALWFHVDINDLELDEEIRLPDGLADDYARARVARVRATRTQVEALELTRWAVHRLSAAGLPARDVGLLLDISHQRVHQLLGEPAPPPAALEAPRETPVPLPPPAPSPITSENPLVRTREVLASVGVTFNRLEVGLDDGGRLVLEAVVSRWSLLVPPHDPVTVVDTRSGREVDTNVLADVLELDRAEDLTKALVVARELLVNELVDRMVDRPDDDRRRVSRKLAREATAALRSLVNRPKTRKDDGR